MAMTLTEKIGQMLLYGWYSKDEALSPTVTDHAAALVDEFMVGGIILMRRNVQNPAQLRGLTDSLQALAARRGLPPLFITIDQEGGKATHLRPPHFLPSREQVLIGNTGDVNEARAGAREIGEQLKRGGINWNFAPVLDVNNNPNNPIIGHRSFGSDADLVSRMGVAAVHGYQDDAGVMSCGKHFPGHGDTDTDSHLALPVIAHNRARLEAIELAPFRAAIKAGIAGIMTSHILFPAFDEKLPATLSPAILTGLLRQEMGFEGVIITDCLEMKGVADGWGEAEAAVMSVEAGSDILLCCHTWSIQRNLQQALIKAVESGRIPESRIDKSVARIQLAKSRWIPAESISALAGAAS